jgi:hypothetical protein
MISPVLGLLGACRPRQNMGDWFHQQGAMLILYFTLGSFAYNYFEGWNTLDAIYFMMVTATTVGYGDIAPVTESGRLFTCAYSLVGITLVLAAIAPFIEWILRGRQALERLAGAISSCCFGVTKTFDENDLYGDIRKYNSRVNYPLRYLRAMLGPLMVLVVGLLLALVVLGCVARAQRVRQRPGVRRVRWSGRVGVAWAAGEWAVRARWAGLERGCGSSLGLNAQLLFSPSHSCALCPLLSRPPARATRSPAKFTSPPADLASRRPTLPLICPPCPPCPPSLSYSWVDAL